MNYIKLMMMALMMCFSFNSFSQKIGFTYVCNPTSTPYGFGIVTLPDANTGPLGVFLNIKFGSSSSGDYRDAYDNSGVYQIGTWGNFKTGRQDSYIESNITAFDFGLRFKQIKNTGLYPFAGIGISNESVTINNYIEAEDVSSGYNVLGYYWVKGTVTTKKYNQGNICFGTYYIRKSLILGLGYNLPWRTNGDDSKSIKTGAQLSVGFCF